MSDKERDRCIKEIISYFHDERSEEIGVIAAGNILDFFLATTGGAIYNKGVEDAKKVLHEQLEGLDINLDLLKRQ